MEVMTSIAVKHVKGIDRLNVNCNFYPNRPNFLVAPNGSGKSSLAVAFSSLNSRRLKLDDSERYQGEDWEDSSIAVAFDSGSLFRADLNTNEIATEMDVQVIRSGLYANMTNRRVGARVLSQTKVSIQQCTIYEKVPDRIRLGYSVSEEKKKYPRDISSKMRNYAEELRSYSFLRDLVASDSAFNATNGARYCSAINDFFKCVISPSLYDNWEKEAIDIIAAVKPLASIKGILDKYFPDESDINKYVNAVQLNRFIVPIKSEVVKACDWAKYEEIKRDVNTMLPLINRTRSRIRAREEKGRLVVDFPDWGDASNGEIDVLQLCAALFKARAKLGKRNKSLLIIDEVFDYLDDANLVVAQYYLLEMMNQFKQDGKSLYVIILTHLDPRLFKSYRFKSFHTSYIDSKTTRIVNNGLTRLLVDRGRCKKEQRSIYEAVSSHYLHFSDKDIADDDVSSYVVSKGIDARLKEPGDFRKEMESKLEDYLSGNDFNSPEVCCGVRIAVERLCYDALARDNRDAYLKIEKGTEPRLSYAEEHGVDVPEAFHLLGTIFNSCMHLTGARGENELVNRQLSNMVIRHLIGESLTSFGWSFDKRQ